MEQAIKKAIEGGYNVGPIEVDIVCDNKHSHYFIDPLFWQSLGKALGWKEDWYYGWFVSVPHGSEWKWVEGKDPLVYWGGTPSLSPNITTSMEAWKYHWTRFIHHLADVKNVDDFFNELLN